MNELWRLLKLSRPYAGWMLLGILLSTLTLFANISLMALSGWFIASMAIAGIAGLSMNYFSPAAAIRAAAIVRTAGRYGERLVTHEATFRLLSNLRIWFYKNLEPLVPQALEDVRDVDLFNRIRADIDSLDNFYLRILVPFSVAALGVLVTTLFVLQYDTTIAVVVLSMLLLAGGVLPLIVGFLSREPGQREVEASAHLRTQVVDGIQGLAELSVLGEIGQHNRRALDASRQWINAQQRMGRLAGVSQAGLLLFANITMWLVLILAIPLVGEQSIEPAELPMLVLLCLAAFEAVMPLPESLRLLGQTVIAAKRVFELIDREPAIQQPKKRASVPVQFDLTVRQLAFSYRADAPVLQGFDLDLPQGKKIALVGATGTGKSSLISLLLRHRQPDSGQIMLGEKDISEFHSEQLHDFFAVVPQQVHLFNTTIRHNLMLANPLALGSDLNKACGLAQIADFIKAQPDGFDTWVGETGVALSGGQARRVAIARALLRDHRCLILDEPGEGLDANTEKQLLTGLCENLEQRSLILITHSRTGLEMMDEILVLDHGKIIERGTYDSLIKLRRQFYRTMAELGPVNTN